MKTIHSIATLAVLLFATTGASAQIHIGPFPIDGMQQVPSNQSPGTGIGDVTLRQDGMLDFNISFQGLLGNEIAAHFHGPAMFGQNGPVVFGLPLGSPKIGSVGPLDAQQQSDLLAGLWYVNIHSSQFPGGEIRGQVVPAPGALALLGLAGLAARRRRR